MADNPGFVDDVGQPQDAAAEGKGDTEAKEVSNVEELPTSTTPNDQVEVSMDAAEPPSKVNGSHGSVLDVGGASPIMDLPPTKPYAGMGKEDLLRFSETPFWNRFRMVCLLLFWLGWLALLGAVIGLTIVAPRCKDPPEPAWWQRSTFYQVYLRSFYDNNGDGIGDIAGLINKLDYIDELNVDTIVLSSIFEWTNEGDLDQEITNHTAIHQDYGSMEEFESLLARVHAMGMKLVLEFIPNHTGKDHPWFNASSANPDPTNPYWNYYVWTDCPGGNPVNNWRSIFGESAWTPDLVLTDRCYLHQMSEDQPDLNLRSGRVRDELDEILLFWLEKGVDGFRVNNAQLLYEDADLRDDNVIDGCDDTVEPYECLDHQYSSNQPEIHDIVAHWRALLNDFGERTGTERILLTDAVTSINETSKYYGTLGRTGAHLPVNYGLRTFIDSEELPEETGGERLRTIIQQWLAMVPEDENSTWAMASQDRARMTFTDAEDELELRAFQVLQMTLPGVPISYYGEEIGMKNGTSSAGTVLGDRIQYRTPMQWDATENAGFSNLTNGGAPADPWTPVNGDYLTVNVETMSNDSAGMNTLSLYKSLSLLRREQEALQYGVFDIALVDENVFSFVREHEGKDRIMVVVNMGSEPVTENFSKSLSLIPDTGETVLTTDPSSELTAGRDKNLRSIPLQPYEAAIFKWAFSR